MAYIDGFVMAVPAANKQKFIDHAVQFDPVFMEHGATRVLECWGDDVKDPRMDPSVSPMPFDGMRMIFGGFAPVVDLGA